MYDREPRVKRLPILFASKPADESLIIKEDGVPSLTNASTRARVIGGVISCGKAGTVSSWRYLRHAVGVEIASSCSTNGI